MNDLYSEMFIQGLKKLDLNKIKKVPKSDLHNHFVLGGNRDYIRKKTGIDIYPIKKALNSMQEMDDWNSKYIGQKFNSIDLYGDELSQPIENFKGIYKRAKNYGIRLKAHVGEWGSAEDIIKAVETLELDEIQHGIAASHSAKTINYLLDNKIRLNIVPTSNVMLGRVSEIKEHPIKEFYKSGLDVTINSDDILIFDSDVSKEYLKLYKNKVLTAEELDEIRLNGLKSVGNNKRKI